MIHVVIIVVMVAPDKDPYEELMIQDQDRRYEELIRERDAMRSRTHSITCPRCKETFYGYASPGRAKMALSGHQRRCKDKAKGISNVSGMENAVG